MYASVSLATSLNLLEKLARGSPPSRRRSRRCGNESSPQIVRDDLSSRPWLTRMTVEIVKVLHAGFDELSADPSPQDDASRARIECHERRETIETFDCARDAAWWLAFSAA